MAAGGPYTYCGCWLSQDDDLTRLRDVDHRPPTLSVNLTEGVLRLPDPAQLSQYPPTLSVNLTEGVLL